MRQLGTYRIVAELGRGGMGVVYKAHDPALHRSVAIKVLSGALAQDEEVRERFSREARNMASLADPHVVTVHTIGEQAGKPYFVMELIDGESLATVINRQHRLNPNDAAVVIHQAAMGLAMAHRKNIVHRDIKPANIMITRKGIVKVADFGISRAPGLGGNRNRLTMTGDFLGTPGYMSPEACKGEPVDARTDVFSLGIVLYECLTGEVPFTNPSPLAHMMQVVESRIPDVRNINSDVDPILVTILEKMMAKHPDDRFHDGGEVAEALLKHPAVKSRLPVSFPIKVSPAKHLPSQLENVSDMVETQRRTPSIPAHKPDWAFHQAPITAKESRPLRLTWILVVMAFAIGFREVWPWIEMEGIPLAIQGWGHTVDLWNWITG